MDGKEYRLRASATQFKILGSVKIRLLGVFFLMALLVGLVGLPWVFVSIALAGLVVVPVLVLAWLFFANATLARPEEIAPAPISNLQRIQKVLLVDDDPVALQLLQHVFKEFGVDVDAHLDPRNAVSAFQSLRYDLVVLDYFMPDLTGNEWLEAVEKMDDVPGLGAGKKTPFVVYSSTPDMFFPSSGELSKFAFQGVWPKQERVSELKERAFSTINNISA